MGAPRGFRLLVLSWLLIAIQAIAADTAHFAVIGDFGYSGTPERDVAALVMSWNPEFVITTGDNNYPDGSDSTIDANIGQYYREFIYPYNGRYGAGAAYNRFFPSLGNHDYYTPKAQPYLDYFTLPGNERYYDFVWGPVHFFALDSDRHEPDGITSTSPQAMWLKAKLASAREPWKVVYFHHSPHSSGGQGSSIDMQWPFKEWGASIVLSGHNHDYERMVINGLTEIVNGLGGQSVIPFKGSVPIPGTVIRYDGDFGAMLVDAGTASMTFQFITRNGTVIDRFTLGTAATPPPAPGPVISAVGNAASYAGGAVAAGEIFTLRGSGLPGPPAAADPEPTRLALAGVQVLFDGVPAPLLYASPTQVNGIVPWSVVGKASVRIQAVMSAGGSVVTSVPVAIAVPGVFTLDASGQGQAAALNEDLSYNGPGNPAARGSIVALYGTGGGPLMSGMVDGATASAAIPAILPVTASVGGIPAEVSYAGAAPGLVFGALQVNLQVPPNVSASPAVPVQIFVAGVPSQAGATIAVQ